MQTKKLLLWTLLGGAWLGGLPATSGAAESYDSCTGTIQSLPATISTQGTWCLAKDLSTAMTMGTAIQVNAHNVTIDCNGFKVGGLGGGMQTEAYGIGTDDRANTTIRNCNIRGFSYGIALFGSGGGHVIENNRLDGSRYIGISVSGDGSTIRGNQIIDTGGGIGGGWATGIVSQGSSEVVDNMIWGLTPAIGRNDAYGLAIGNNFSGRVAGNRVSGNTATNQMGIRSYASSSRVRVIDNMLDSTGWHVYCDLSTTGAIRNNIASGGSSFTSNCFNLGGNVIIP